MNEPKVVAISGYFDPLHKGHLEMIKSVRDKYPFTRLICIVNNDKQAILKKGKSFMDEQQRLDIMNMIKGIDYAVLSLDEDSSICYTLRQVNPDIFCNGGDRHQGEVPESEVCRELGIVMEDGFGEKIESSSRLVKEAEDG